MSYNNTCDKIATKEIYENLLKATNKDVTFAEDAADTHHQHPAHNRQQQPAAEEFGPRFRRKLKHDCKRVKSFIKTRLAQEQEKLQRNEQELDELKKHYNNMLAEKTEMKRTFWCRYCEAEATYLSRPRPYFYCSTECEQYHQNLLGVLIEGFKANLDIPTENSSLFP